MKIMGTKSGIVALKIFKKGWAFLLGYDSNEIGDILIYSIHAYSLMRGDIK